MTTELSDALVTIGRIVVYVLSVDDAMKINRRRTTGESIAERMATEVRGDGQGSTLAGTEPPRVLGWPAGAQAHIGNEVVPGQHFPAIVVRVMPGPHKTMKPLTAEDAPDAKLQIGTDDRDFVNLQVFLDGSDVFWVCNVQNDGDCSFGTWHWPKRV